MTLTRLAAHALALLPGAGSSAGRAIFPWIARVSLPSERRERPVVSAGVCHSEIPRWIVDLIRERVHDGGADP
jgi:hypothetical protein